jgi:hypothetical protein
MHAIVDQLRNYFRAVNPLALLFTSLLTAMLIFFNYSVGIESRIVSFSSPLLKFTGFVLLFAFTFCGAWLMQTIFSKENIFAHPFFYVLLIASPIIFAGKVTFDWFPPLLTQQLSYPWNQYWSVVLNWPLKGALVFTTVALLWRWGKYAQPMAGLSTKDFTARPYFLLLLFMVPLLALAATQDDFLRVYPKWQRVDFIEPYLDNTLPAKLLFELSYGLDFITIELFFRGFLILAFVRYAGKAAILPMAAFYCSIHFGKPVFECITSYVGGIILGVIVYHSRSIWGGLIVHLGIAWLMEIAGYAGRAFTQNG